MTGPFTFNRARLDNDLAEALLPKFGDCCLPSGPELEPTICNAYRADLANEASSIDKAPGWHYVISYRFEEYDEHGGALLGCVVLSAVREGDDTAVSTWPFYVSELGNTPHARVEALVGKLNKLAGKFGAMR